MFAALLAVAALLSGPAPDPGSGNDVVAGLHVLHAWDEQRESAWAARDARALRRLYVPGSRAGPADVRLLRAYDARGLVVRRIVTQVLEVRVLHLDGHRMRLRVVDRVAGGLLGDRPLGSTRPRQRVVELRRSAGRWQVLSVTLPDPQRAPRARPGRGR